MFSKLLQISKNFSAYLLKNSTSKYMAQYKPVMYMYKPIYVC